MNRQTWKRIVVLAMCVCVTLLIFTAATPAHAAPAPGPAKHPSSFVRASTVRPSSCVSYAGTWRMYPGYTFAPGDSITAYTCSGQPVKLIYQTDNNFVLYINGRPKWSSQTYFNGPEIKPDYAQFQTDGNLVAYSYVLSGNYYYVNALWSSRTNGEGATNLDLQEDGNLVIYKNNSNAPSNSLWASNTCCYG